MQAAVELIFQRRIHCPLHLYPALSFKSWRDNLHLIMGLAFRAGASMACMFCAVIADKQLARCKKLRQSRANPL